MRTKYNANNKAIELNLNIIPFRAIHILIAFHRILLKKYSKQFYILSEVSLF